MSQRRLRACCLLVVLAGAAAAARAEFCEDLEAILDAAVDGFTAIRGELVTRHEDPVSDTRVVWQCTLALTGAHSCEVEWLRQAFTYNTFWNKQDEGANAETAAALRELLEGCGLTQNQASKSGRTILYQRQGETHLDVILAFNSRRVRLSVSASGFPNP